jgi:hypothetical protein
MTTVIKTHGMKNTREYNIWASMKAQIQSVKVSEGVYMLQGMGGNIGVSSGADGILLVDSQFAQLHEKIKATLATIGVASSLGLAKSAAARTAACAWAIAWAEALTAAWSRRPAALPPSLPMTRSCRAFKRFLAMGLPMIPKPINPNSVIPYLLIGISFFHVVLKPNLLAVFLAFIISTGIMMGLAMISTGFRILTKSTDPITWAINVIQSLFSGVAFPVIYLDTIFFPGVSTVSWFLPQTWVYETGWPIKHIDFTYWLIMNNIHPMRAYYSYFPSSTLPLVLKIGDTQYFTADYIIDLGPGSPV